MRNINLTTPGPWHIDEGENGDVLVTATPGDPDEIDNDVCHVYGGNDNDKTQALVDARLIVAAPELLAYAQYVGDNLERIERGGWTPLCFEEFQGSEECETYQQRGNQ